MQQWLFEPLKCKAAFGIESTELNYPSKRSKTSLGFDTLRDSVIHGYKITQDDTGKNPSNWILTPPKTGGWRLIEDWMILRSCQSVSFDLLLDDDWRKCFCATFWNLDDGHYDLWLWWAHFDPRAATVAWRVGASPFSKMTTWTTIPRSAAARR